MRAALLLLVACGRIGFGERVDPIDAAVPTDAIEAACDPAPAADTIALYTFEGDLGNDATREHDGSIRMGVTATTSRCGDRAAHFGTGYLLVADHAEFDLAAGSLELFARLRSTGADQQTLFARDATGTAMPGHLVLLVTTANELVVRLQAGGTTFYRCGDFALDRWVQIGVSFGAPDLRLWIDGVAATNPTATLDGATITCGAALAAGIAGNDNAVVIGASNARLSGESDPTPAIDQYVLDGDLDHVHLRSTWRDFTR